jgi:hypothetical protein
VETNGRNRCRPDRVQFRRSPHRRYQFCGEAALWPEILHKIRRSQLYTTAKPATVMKVRTTTVASCG